MAKGWKSKGGKGIELQIAELEIKRRNGLLRGIGSIFAFVLVAAAYTWMAYNYPDLEGNMVIRAMIYITAMVLAGTSGYGFRAWYRRDKEIKELEATLTKKKKRK